MDDQRFRALQERQLALRVEHEDWDVSAALAAELGDEYCEFRQRESASMRRERRRAANGKPGRVGKFASVEALRKLPPMARRAPHRPLDGIGDTTDRPTKAAQLRRGP